MGMDRHDGFHAPVRILVACEDEDLFQQLVDSLTFALSGDENAGVQDQTHRSIPSRGQWLLAILNDIFEVLAKVWVERRCRAMSFGQSDAFR